MKFKGKITIEFEGDAYDRDEMIDYIKNHLPHHDGRSFGAFPVGYKTSRIDKVTLNRVIEVSGEEENKDL